MSELTLKRLNCARELAGNWRKFESFIWYGSSKLPDADNWAIVYTQNRDSRLLVQSNAGVMEAAMLPFTEGEDPDVLAEEHRHWVCGWIKGFAIRVFVRRGNKTTTRLTPAFRAWYQLRQRMDDYPVLDEKDYSQREYDATLEYIREQGRRVEVPCELPEDWTEQVYGWLAEHDARAIENHDDQGGCPSEAQILAAITALGWIGVEVEDE